MGEHGCPTGDGDDDEGQVQIAQPGRGRDRRRHQGGRGGQGYGGRALGHPQGGGDQEGGQDHRHAGVGEHVSQGCADAAGTQHAAEHATGTRHQDDGADGGQGVVAELLELHLALGLTEQPEGIEHCDEQGHRGLADHAQHVHPVGTLVDHPHDAQGVEAGIHEDEHQRQQQDGEHLAKARRLVGESLCGLGEARGQGQLKLLAGPEPEQIGTQIPGRQRDQQTHYGEQPYVGTQQFAGGHRARVGWQEGVHHREGTGGGQGIFED
ncbi:hypothetical protein D3C80_480580 [compost metagenome]